MRFRIREGKSVFLRGETYLPGEEARLPPLDMAQLARLERLGIIIEVAPAESAAAPPARRPPPEEPAVVAHAGLPAEERRAVVAGEKPVPSNTWKVPKSKWGKRPRRVKMGKVARRHLEKRKAALRKYERSLPPRDEEAERQQDVTMAFLATLSLTEIENYLLQFDSSWEVIRFRYLDRRPGARALYDRKLKELAER